MSLISSLSVVGANVVPPVRGRSGVLPLLPAGVSCCNRSNHRYNHAETSRVTGDVGQGVVLRGAVTRG